MANGKQLLGQILYGIRRLPVKFIQQMVDEATVATLVGAANVEITPNDAQSWETKTFDTSAIQAVLDAEFLVIESSMNIEGVPPVLSDLTILYEKGGGSSTASEAIEVLSVTTPFSVGISPSANAEATSYCIPKVKYKLTPFNGANRRVKLCYFYMTTVTRTAVLSRISASAVGSCAAWPVFTEDSISLILRGERVQTNSRGSFGFSASVGGGDSVVVSEGSGNGQRVEPTIDPVQLPMAIHGAFNAYTTSDTNTKTAAGTYAVTGWATVNTTGGGSVNCIASADVSPTSIAASSPTSAWPGAGNYLYRFTPQPEDAFGRILVEAVVFDFTW